MRSILYISYDGLTDPLGQSQILAYLKRLSKLDNQIVILSFEKIQQYKKGKDEINDIIKENELIWFPIMYTKTPPVFSTVFDIYRGINKSKILHKKYMFDIVHCRGYIAAIIGKKLKELFGLQFIFDMRGWWADEKLESGLWGRKIYQPVYHYFKKLEKDFFLKSDFIVSLTDKGKTEIQRLGLAESHKIGVIPTCVDFQIFRPWSLNHRVEVRKKLNIPLESKVFVYAGSLGGNYDISTLISVFKSFQKKYPQSFLLILSKDDFNESLNQIFLAAGIINFSIHKVPFTSVTDFLRVGDVGFIYYKMSFSTIGRSPTKLGEYWASGLQVIAFRGIGDLDYILGRYPESGVLLSEDENNWSRELENLHITDHTKLRTYSENYFHIEKGIEFYQDVYELLSPLIKAKADISK